MLKKIAKRINKELEQARDYAQQAFLVKDKHQQTADLFATLAEEEIVHAEKLLREGNRLVNANKAYSYDKTPQAENEAEAAWHEKCKVIWEWESRFANEMIAECRHTLSMYRGG